MKRLQKYLPKKVVRKQLPTKISESHVKLAQQSAHKLNITLREFLEAAIEMANDELKKP